MANKFFYMLVTAGFAYVTGSAALAADIEQLPLSDVDCVKCHYQVAVDVDAGGAAHKELSCQECHEEHPPAGTNTIPECGMCHAGDDNEHFAIERCLNCHSPHSPLRLDFTDMGSVAYACATCHHDKIDEMAARPSAHSEQDCSACHGQHGLQPGQYSACLDCHEGHSAEMVNLDCLKCHRPHSPANVEYGDDVAVSLCASCHEDVAASLGGKQTMHSEMACVECHSSAHKNITACVDCHDLPHDEYMHTKFPECINCHRDPHNLAK